MARHRKAEEVTDSADGIGSNWGDEIPFPDAGLTIAEGGTELPSVTSGDTAPVGRHQKPLLEQPDKTRDTSIPKKGAPTVDEWQDFIGRIVLHTAMEAYVAWVLRDIELTEAEIESISLTCQDYKEMSAPFATYTANNDWAKKHGREIIGAADSIEAAVALGIWMRRVHKIARKHRPERQAARRSRPNPSFASRSASEIRTPAMPERPREAPPVVPARPQEFSRPSGEQLAAMAGSHINQTEGFVNGNSGQTTAEGVYKPRPPGTFGGNFTGNPGTG